MHRLAALVSCLALAACSASGIDETPSSSAEADALAKGDLSAAQAKDVLLRLDQLCGDTWCDGDYEFKFDAVGCHFKQGTCTLSLEAQSIDGTSAWEKKSCTWTGMTSYAAVMNDVNGYTSLTEAVSDQMFTCTQNIESDLNAERATMFGGSARDATGHATLTVIGGGKASCPVTNTDETTCTLTIDLSTVVGADDRSLTATESAALGKAFDAGAVLVRGNFYRQADGTPSLRVREAYERVGKRTSEAHLFFATESSKGYDFVQVGGTTTAHSGALDLTGLELSKANLSALQAALTEGTQTILGGAVNGTSWKATSAYERVATALP